MKLRPYRPKPLRNDQHPPPLDRLSQIDGKVNSANRNTSPKNRLTIVDGPSAYLVAMAFKAMHAWSSTKRVNAIDDPKHGDTGRKCEPEHRKAATGIGSTEKIVGTADCLLRSGLDLYGTWIHMRWLWLNGLIAPNHYMSSGLPASPD
ncbi:hypothetical protein RF11_11915 [Thelohanellus kitauei]|uniref:Uncharacterized protein n=1 Tax=Thelohanellus kitauei TaxID=669202 RepID=A0A0C2JP09_THEKT|nr:hypothetical protein RF11_11915 [Thelohanellus kitauei]